MNGIVAGFGLRDEEFSFKLISFAGGIWIETSTELRYRCLTIALCFYLLDTILNIQNDVQYLQLADSIETNYY